MVFVKKIADLLIAFRAICGPIILLTALLLSDWKIATVVLLAGVLSGAFDGPASRRWPPPNPEDKASISISQVAEREARHSLADCVLLYLAMATISYYSVVTQHSWMILISLAILLIIGAPILLYYNKYKNSEIESEKVLSVRANGWLGACYFVQSFVVVGLFTSRAFGDLYSSFLIVYVIVAAWIIFYKWDQVARIWAKTA
jgi:hypothetical protein